ncbi:hypothetical protein [Saccharopolyspora hattusasensis]|uniref:hypothetical protein n=1 Tax=Saccharopolyspora hattusasensis TaxID=1128679 RepID=UPI003D980F05
MDAAKLNEGARELLEQLTDRLPKRRLPSYRALGEAGESTSLLNEICKMLVNRHTEVTPAEKDTLHPAPRHGANRRQRLRLHQQPRSDIGFAPGCRSTTRVTTADLNWLNTKSQQLLERFAGRLSPHDLESNRTLGFAGEQAIMLNNLCASLVKDEISVTPHEQQALAELLNWFRPATVADLIRDRENTLASLNLTDQP